MCGIVGYVGNKPVLDILLNGLTKLEYRGYDSAGVALYRDDSIEMYKEEGKLDNLKNLVKPMENELKSSTMGIGHIRWATHGAPTTTNAHPHSCNCGNLVIVHNGIIENFKELRAELENAGCVFRSQTDTETLAHLIAKEYATVKNLTEAVRIATRQVQGAYAICVMHKDYPNTIVATKRNAPLLIGVGNNEYYVASDVPAIIDYTKNALYLDDDQIATLTPSSIKLINKYSVELQPHVEQLPWESVSLSKMGYKHFMLKEIHEQPSIIRNLLSGKVSNFDKPINLEEVKLDKEIIKNLNRIQVVACGTSMHAAMVGKYILEDFCGISVDVEPSSEFIYRKTTTNEKTLVIGVSQSGETADTITAVKQSKKLGSHILIITNRPDSTMAREADSLIPVNAGIEVSVAATKSYMAQLLSFYLLALHIAEIKGSIEPQLLKDLKQGLIELPEKAEIILENKKEIQTIAKKYASFKNFVFVARGINYATALEGALKLKEISYINATGYPAGELKHGPIAMLDETMPVLSIMTKGIVYDKILSNSEEAKARDARMIVLTNSDDTNIDSMFESIIRIPETDEYLSPILTIIPLQLIAYYIAEFLGKDVDQPRNLAKSVTVE